MNSVYYVLRRVTRPAYRIEGVGLGRACELIRRTVAKHPPPTPLIVDDFRGNARFRCFLGDHMGSQIFFRGSYSGDQLDTIEQILSAGAVFVDAGANQGEFTIAAANVARKGTVIAFEPVSEYRERLIENVRLNGFENVRVVAAALGEVTGELPIYDAQDRFADGTKHDGLTTLFASESRRHVREVVPVRRLDDVLAELGVTRLDVMKLDIEGAEWMALRGAVNTLAVHRPVLILEVGRDTCRAAGYEPEAFVAWLTSQNYRLERITERGKREPIPAGALDDFQNVVAYPS